MKMKSGSTISLPVHPVHLAEWENPHYKAYFWLFVTIGLVIFIFFLIALKICYTTYCVAHEDCPCHKCDPDKKHSAWGEQNLQLIESGGNNLGPGPGMTKINLESPTKTLTETDERKPKEKEFKLTALQKRPHAKPLALEFIDEVQGDSGISSPGGKSSASSTSPSRLEIPDYHRRYSQPQVIPTGIHQVDGPVPHDPKSGIGFNTQV